ncbi:MAG: gamma carbonic anhydrase family protein [Rubrivivax sp.]
MAIYRLGDRLPQVDPTAWVADSASVMGRAEIGAGSSIWYGAVLRADNDVIRIGARTSIQDGAVLHTDPGLVLEVGEDCIVGHQCMLHGCSIGDGTLIGIQAVVLNRARIGRHCLVGAGAVVTEGKEFPEGSMILGAPAKVVRSITPEEIERFAKAAARYVQLGAMHRDQLQRID